MNKWTLHVREFGKIEKADVEVAPMTIFLGDNNSGKSYLMTLIYGLLNLHIYFQKYVFQEDSQEYKECALIVEKMVDHWNTDYRLQKDEIQRFEQLFNRIMEENMSFFLKNLFNKDMEIGQLQVEFSTENEYIFEVLYDSELQIYCKANKKELMSGFSWGENIGDKKGWTKFFIAYILESLIKKDYINRGNNPTIYFPTARTGYLLTYKTLAGNAVQEKFSADVKSENYLTKPNVDFLSALSRISVQNQSTRYKAVVNFIEKHVIGGQLKVSDLPAKDIMYVPEGQSKMLPMYVTSGVVTEMTPLLLFLQYKDVAAMLMEEPEISLHPQLQIEIARTLIRLVNSGMPVFVTTHSDIIIQHMNNMIKLSETAEKEKLLEKLDYEETDLLCRENIKVYQFEVQKNHKTLVECLPCGEYGFEAMTFYNTLKKLNEQIDLIEGMGEE